MSTELTFIEVDASPRTQQHWPTLIMPRAAIEAEIERLASTHALKGRRASSINHPMNTGPVSCLAPGIDVTLEVLKPGEQSEPIAANSSRVDICLRGEAVAHIGRQESRLSRFDVWNTPSMEPAHYRNTGRDLFVRLSYSNAPLLERLEVHYVQPEAPVGTMAAEAVATGDGGRSARSAATPIPVGRDGAQLLGYEWLVDIEVVESKALVWPWREVEPHLESVAALDKTYSGRNLYILHNPATGRFVGTTPAFFASIAKYPANRVDRPHRHSSAAINYIMQGSGRSAVEGDALFWSEGDLHFSAPGWAVHNHASREEGFTTLTIQDHPLHLANESLLWQETMKSPIVKLGAQPGIQTNLAALVA